MKKDSFLAEDLFATTYQSELSNFQETKQYKELQEKFAIKPFYKTHSNYRKLCSVVSYLFNIASILLGSVFVYNLFIGLFSPIVAILSTLAILVILEAFKRLTTPYTAKSYFQFKKLLKIPFTASLLLFCLSAFVSFKGGDIAPKELKSLELSSTDSISSKYNYIVQQLSAKQDSLRSIKYKGNTTRTAQKAIGAIQKEINLRTEIYQSELDRIEKSNHIKTTEFNSDTQSKGLYLAILALLIDCCLILCLVFLEYYDYRAFQEFTTLTTVTTLKNSTSPENIDSALDSALDGAAKKPLSEPEQIAPENILGTYIDCLHCQKPTPKTHHNKKYCSAECRIKASEQRNGKPVSFAH